MLETIGNKVTTELKYCKNLIYKIKEGTLKFYYSSDRFTKPIFLRSFVDNNFNKESKFYVEFDKVLNAIRSDYIYIDNKPIIKIEKV